MTNGFNKFSTIHGTNFQKPFFSDEQHFICSPNVGLLRQILIKKLESGRGGG